MTEPSPAVLRGYAAELRELARAQENRAPAIHDLMDKVVKLDDSDTWTGGFAMRTGIQFNKWDLALQGTAADCADDAARWRTMATRLEERADEAEQAQGDEDGGG